LKQILEPGETPATWDPEALWGKVLRYSETMLARKETPWEQAFWSSLLLEHLARAALSNVHPTLLAETGKAGWSSQLHALGLPIKESKFSPRSIPISEVFNRLKELFADFTPEDAAFCSSHMNLRNTEIHTGETAFDDRPPDTWQPKFYKACKALLACMGLELKDMLTSEETGVAEQLIAADSDKSSAAVKGDVEAHRKVWLAKSDDERANLAQAANVWATKQTGHRVTCPACGSRSLVFGEPAGAIEVTLEDGMVVERQEYLPSAFECVACDLKISGLSRLVAVELGNRFSSKSEFYPEDYYATEDPEWGAFEEDNNEPF